jgi:hypothetical protein
MLVSATPKPGVTASDQARLPPPPGVDTAQHAAQAGRFSLRSGKRLAFHSENQACSCLSKARAPRRTGFSAQTANPAAGVAPRLHFQSVICAIYGVIP